MEEDEKLDKQLTWEINDCINRRYQEEIRRIKAELTAQGVDLTSEDGRRRFREAILTLNRSFYVLVRTDGSSENA